jgi:hypothetical protein
MGNSASVRVALLGNDGAGKTTLLERAVLERDAPVVTVSTNGINEQHVSVGGGIRSIGMQLGMAETCQALVFVVRATDSRLWSALWELHAAVCARGSPMLPVCVAIITDSALALGRSGGAADDERWPSVAQMAARECLPPGGTARWSPARRNVTSKTGADPDAAEALPPQGEPSGEAPAAEAPAVEAQAVKSPAVEAPEATNETDPDSWVDGTRWLDAWEADRQEVLRTGRTASHGLPVSGVGANVRHGAWPLDLPLASWHEGPWVVVPIDPINQFDDAKRPFRWVANELRGLQRKGYPQAFQVQ